MAVAPSPAAFPPSSASSPFPPLGIPFATSPQLSGPVAPANESKGLGKESMAAQAMEELLRALPQEDEGAGPSLGRKRAPSAGEAGSGGAGSAGAGLAGAEPLRKRARLEGRPRRTRPSGPIDPSSAIFVHSLPFSRPFLHSEYFCHSLPPDSISCGGSPFPPQQSFKASLFPPLLPLSQRPSPPASARTTPSASSPASSWPWSRRRQSAPLT